jgi:Ni/Co efflux regulator RcnB
MRLLSIIISIIILTAVNAPVVIAQDTGQQEEPSQDRRRRQDGQPRDREDRQPRDGQPRGERQGERRQGEERQGDGTPRNAPRFRERMVVLEIDARLTGQNETVIWSESHRKETLLGRPVGIKLVGSNLIVDVQFTPYSRMGTRYRVAQAQIWMEIPNEGIRYYTTMQTIPVEFGELVYFFPLGPRSDGDDSRIEMMLTLRRHEEN